MSTRLAAAVVAAWLVPLALSMCSDTRHECGQWAKDSHCADNPECESQLLCSNSLPPSRPASAPAGSPRMRSSWQS